VARAIGVAVENFLSSFFSIGNAPVTSFPLNCRSLLAVLSLAVLTSTRPPMAAQTASGLNQTPRPTARAVDARVDSLIAKMTVAEQAAQLQDRAPAIPRLALPAYNWWNEGLHGIARNGYATVFPQAIGLAATFDTALLQEVGETVSIEARAKFNAEPRGDWPRYGGLTVWSPNINIFRDPRWGRGQETYGEDPFLTGALGSAFVRGVQGDDPFYRRADATPKHFVAHSGPEEGRDSFNAVVSQHDLNDTYLAAFHTVITQGKAAAMMCSYNAINGTPSCANSGLLQDVVRDRWHFGGYIVSDCDAVGNLTDYQHYTVDKVHGAAAALNAGVDLDCGDSYLPLTEALQQHLVTEAAMHKALHRLLVARVELGALDANDTSPYDAIKPEENDSSAHRALALKASEESVVLLQNDGTLPLKPTQRIAVIGPTADMLKVLEANYHATASNPITPMDGLSKVFRDVRYAQGSLLAAGLAAPVSRTALRTGKAPDSPHGLKAEYFATPSFEGAPMVTQTVDTVDLDLDRVGPSPAIVAKKYAARWSGYLTPPAAGVYTLRVNIERCWDCTTHDRFKLSIDGKPVIENDGSKAGLNTVSMHFDNTAAHAVRLELIHSGEDEGIALEWQPPADALLAQAIDVAKDSDVIVAFVGLSPDLEGEALHVHLEGFNGGDRVALDLPAAQRNLLARLRELHKPMVVVLTSASAVSLNPEERSASAVLEAWYPGEEGGIAIANILSGKTNPSGRLPVTFYTSAKDLPKFSDYSMAHRTYRYFDGPVLYPFGFGLSYTTFKYSDLRLSKSEIAAGDALTATVTIANTGRVSGSEVAELYVRPPSAPGMPRLALQSVQRVVLKAGESREVAFHLEPEQLSFVDADGRRAIRAGEYRIAIGGGQPAGLVGALVKVRGEKVIEY
jgi:beta-glucosidase